MNIDECRHSQWVVHKTTGYAEQVLRLDYGPPAKVVLSDRAVDVAEVEPWVPVNGERVEARSRLGRWVGPYWVQRFEEISDCVHVGDAHGVGDRPVMLESVRPADPKRVGDP